MGSGWVLSSHLTFYLPFEEKSCEPPRGGRGHVSLVGDGHGDGEAASVLCCGRHIIHWGKHSLAGQIDTGFCPIEAMWGDMTLRKHEYLDIYVDRYVVLRHFTGMMVNGRLKCNLARSLSTVNISHYYSATSIYVQNGHIAIANWLCLVVVFLHYCTRPWARGEEPTTRWVSAAPHHSIAVSPLCPVCPVWPLCPPLCPLSPHCTVGKQSVDQLRRFSKVDINGVLVVSAVLLPVVSLVSLKYQSKCYLTEQTFSVIVYPLDNNSIKSPVKFPCILMQKPSIKSKGEENNRQDPPPAPWTCPVCGVPLPMSPGWRQGLVTAWRPLSADRSRSAAEQYKVLTPAPPPSCRKPPPAPPRPDTLPSVLLHANCCWITN